MRITREGISHTVSTCVGRRVGVVRGFGNSPQSSLRPHKASRCRGPKTGSKGNPTPSLQSDWKALAAASGPSTITHGTASAAECAHPWHAGLAHHPRRRCRPSCTREARARVRDTGFGQAQSSLSRVSAHGDGIAAGARRRSSASATIPVHGRTGRSSEVQNAQRGTLLSHAWP